MKFTKFKEIVSRLVELEKKKQEYFDSVPCEIREIFINPYIDSLYSQYMLMFGETFGQCEVDEDVDWFMYEWKPGYQIEVVSGKTYTINSIEDYFDYIAETYKFEEE